MKTTTPALSARTIELLTDIKFNILAVPETFRMEREFQYEEESPCGTAACIAGHAYAMNHNAKQLSEFNDVYFGIIETSMDFLDLSREQADRLFYFKQHTTSSYRWPQRFEERYWEAKTAKSRAKVAAERIDHFIATGGQE